MSEAATKMKSAVIKKRAKVTIAGTALGFVKDGTCTFKVEPGEKIELKEEGGAVVFTEVGKAKRTLTFDVMLETLDELENNIKQGDIKLEIEGQKSITYANATAIITREWTNANGAIDHYECTLPEKGTQGEEATL